MSSRRLILFAAVPLVCFIAIISWFLKSKTVQVMNPVSGTVTFVIDAGHGGEDGGAVSVSGYPESMINLDIALKLEQILALYGVSPVMLRNEDISLHDDTATTLREKKTSDLKNRVSMVQNTDRAVLVSIHQNSFQESRYKGAQVFFAPTEGSQELASLMQPALAAALDPNNERQAKPIPDTVYLMNHITCPAILIECGFLTNPEEEVLLRQDAYQMKIASAITSVLVQLDME